MLDLPPAWSLEFLCEFQRWPRARDDSDRPTDSILTMRLYQKNCVIFKRAPTRAHLLRCQSLFSYLFQLATVTFVDEYFGRWKLSKRNILTFLPKVYYEFRSDTFRVCWIEEEGTSGGGAAVKKKGNFCGSFRYGLSFVLHTNRLNGQVCFDEDRFRTCCNAKRYFLCVTFVRCFGYVKL